MTDAAPQISVVLPAHNEEGNVAAMAARLAAILSPLGSYEIVFVDDRSTDRTLDAIRTLGAADRRVRYRVVRAQLRPSGGAARRAAPRARQAP